MWLVLFAWLGAAEAAEVALVGLHDPTLDERAQQDAVAALAAAVRAAGHTPVGPDVLAERLRGREDVVLGDALLGTARRLVEEGRVLYQQAEPDSAVAPLEAAVAAYEDVAGDVPAPVEAWEAWMLLGTARVGTGDEIGARDALAAAVALLPDRKPDPARFPPDVVRLHEDERRAALEEAVDLDVTATVAEGTAARVLLDGRDVGALPARLRKVLPGRHHVAVRTEDGRYGDRAIDVLAGGGGVVRVEVGAPRLSWVAGTEPARSQQIAGLYAALGAHGRVPLVLLGGRVDGGVQLQLHDVAAGAFSEPVGLSSAADAAELGVAVASLLRRVDAAGGVPASTTVFTALPLQAGDDPLLGRLLLAPARALPVPVEPVAAAPVGAALPEPTGARRPRWPVWLGVGLGALAAAGLGVGLGVGLAPDDPVSGTLTVGPPLR